MLIKREVLSLGTHEDKKPLLAPMPMQLELASILETKSPMPIFNLNYSTVKKESLV